MDRTNQPCSPDRRSKEPTTASQPFSQRCCTAASISPTKLTDIQNAAMSRPGKEGF